MIKAKLIIASALLAGLAIYVGVTQADKSSLKDALADAHVKIGLLEATLNAAQANVEASNAVIDKQNTLIAEQEKRISTARTLAAAQLDKINRLATERRAAVRDKPPEEELEAIRGHLAEFLQ